MLLAEEEAAWGRSRAVLREGHDFTHQDELGGAGVEQVRVMSRLGMRLVALALAVIGLQWFRQTFSLPFLLTRGGPASATTTLILLQYQAGFVNLQLGLAAASTRG